jgi:transposase
VWQEAGMRGDEQQLQTGMFSYVALEDRIPAEHPLRGVRKLVDTVLAKMSKDFDGLYSQVGRRSIAPEWLQRALLLPVFYSVRSERLLMEQLNYNLLFRWFVGLEIEDAVWNHAVFSKNRDRLLLVPPNGQVIRQRLEEEEQRRVWEEGTRNSSTIDHLDSRW